MIYVSPVRIEVATAPTGLPVSVAQVKERARMDAGDTMMNATIEAYIKAVWKKVEAYTGLALLQTSFKAYYDSFPVVIAISKAPKIVVTKLEYIDINGILQTLDSSIYQIQLKKHDFNIFPKSEQKFPDVKRHTTDAVVVSFQAGWSTLIPDDIKEAILHAVVAMLGNGESKDCFSQCSLPAISKSLLYDYRDVLALMR